MIVKITIYHLSLKEHIIDYIFSKWYIIIHYKACEVITVSCVGFANNEPKINCSKIHLYDGNKDNY